MIDALDLDTRRADAARLQLLRDIREMKKIGSKMIKNTETAMHKAPVLLGLGAVAIALLGVTIFARRRSAPRFSGPAPERSFLAQAARSAALSALGILSGRITQRLLSAAMSDSTQRGLRE